MVILPYRPMGLLNPEHHNIIYDDHLIGLVPILGQSIKNQGWKEKFRVKTKDQSQGLLKVRLDFV